MNTKLARRLLVIAIVVVTVLANQPVSPVFAEAVRPPEESSRLINGQGPDCRVNASKTSVGIGEEVMFSVETSVVGTLSWDFGDGNQSLEVSPKHAFSSLNDYVVMAKIRNDRYGLIWCTEAIKVNGSIPVVSSTPAPVLPQSTPAPVIVDGESDEIQNSTEGDGSPNIVVNDSENVKITVENPATEQPIIIMPEPVVTQKTNVFTAVIHAFLKAFEEFFHTLDESWFKPVLVQ